jgi:hypothetical protein
MSNAAIELMTSGGVALKPVFQPFFAGLVSNNDIIYLNDQYVLSILNNMKLKQLNNRLTSGTEEASLKPRTGNLASADRPHGSCVRVLSRERGI